MPHRPTIWPIEPPCHAPLIAANFGRATRELHSSLIKRSNSASSVGRVDRRRQSVEQVAKLPAPVAELALRLHLLLGRPLVGPVVSAVEFLITHVSPGALAWTQVSPPK